MGIFDFFKGGGGKNKIEKYARKLRKKDTPVEERESIAEWLAEDGSDDAILALLGRFEMTYEHGMKDAQEKARVESLVLGLGSKAVGPLETFLKRCRSFSRHCCLSTSQLTLKSCCFCFSHSCLYFCLCCYYLCLCCYYLCLCSCSKCKNRFTTVTASLFNLALFVFDHISLFRLFNC